MGRPHTTEYWDFETLDYVKVDKVAFDTKDAAVAAARDMMENERRPAPHGYNVYICTHCEKWHVGRHSPKRRARFEQTDRGVLLSQLRWALWRYANGYPVANRYNPQPQLLIEKFDSRSEKVVA